MKRIRRLIAFVLSIVMMCSLSVNAGAIETDDYITAEFFTSDGTLVEKVEFEENGEYAAVIKRTYIDGSFDVTSINGAESVTFIGEVSSINAPIEETLVLNGNIEIANVTYPHYTPYWYAGYIDYSQNGVALSVAVIAGLLVAYLGLGASAATTTASAIYTALGSNIYSDVYFRTYRYYATLEYGPGQPTIWYNKHVTYTYSNSGRTEILTGPHTEIYESANPM